MAAEANGSVLVQAPARWTGPGGVDPSAQSLVGALGIHPLVAAVLCQRGLTDPGSARTFLYPENTPLHDPWLMRDMDAAVSRMTAAIRNREKILLYGDYDVDGTCSVVVLKKAIELLGGSADYFIPHRLRDGYGMRVDAVEAAAADGVTLIISVDTGIRASAVVAHATQLGIDVIITDHHLPNEDLPPALAVLNPNRPDCTYPNHNLCGAGVTFKLVEALLAASDLPGHRKTSILESLIKPVAIATVADIVSLTGENRVIVKRGLSGLRHVRNLGLKALMRVAGFEPGDSPSAHSVAFRLAPRMNAAGRLDTAQAVIELFLTGDPDRAEELAGRLDALNRERQEMETTILESVLDGCEKTPDLRNQFALVFAAPGWHLGVLGIVASRLVERFSRPVFLLSEANERQAGGEPCFAGSGRSIPPFHLLEALESMPELFLKFGGHRQAAGLTLRCSDVEQFRRRLDQFAASHLTLDDLCPHHSFDTAARFSDFSGEIAEQVLSLGPFGFGNPLPTFLCEKVTVVSVPRPSQNRKHYTIPMRQEGRTLMIKAWNFRHRIGEFQPGSELDVLVQIEDDPLARKRGFGSWCITLKDARTRV